MKIILGSSSPRRQKLLSYWGYQFETLNPQIDEKSIRSGDLRALPLLVAKAKNQSLLAGIKEPAILITCDTIVIHDGELYEKPQNESEARRMLESYGAKPAEVICGVVVTNTKTGKTAQGLDSTKVYFHKIPAKLIDEMVKLGRVLDFAGAFHLDDPPIKPYIVHIDGELGTVMGLPRILTKQLIEQVKQ
ncbi:MAG: septum formation protein Maf [Candidatus Doudnabacteria bacterium RIFCSPLOWO2_02_FULL_49_13]|uniref:Nucleoside triphosphate pyrophosphatase n=1 Tax=Candidatus Doudnabacteria bacterium RIFCSPHIGHO2_12_FULL_48_16 TaxID=1817838 RepID=A0A1F5PKW2_9BACT|nr:MAG: septum formation protein Maf [Candidatus Doudnabacteria bacterium RIFCSPHIGHO2_02_FULL_49_24]OGE89163.1 MAG: septum formation protein Maf [Candidatus Doudnabacteria bacterium RIFCSPHIGHO2_01_FULL_50_67]OGE90541.1 MAG: septum formation protein Maf [Candidatus Doudnabacteria bacterium RIFCSPHIGHO2_12_FULL_48_16]OGE97189.1 MAG: septum formation protein Maf [Candidatus Doudnabacteria bacterium RIFCSPLOWO2_01_FULL_49_40]OGF02933.1 MAG: septum formation protein Maf [Candidatus Doudnabacteria 